MKRTVAVILVTLLVVPSASAAQQPSAPIDWQKVQKLEAGTTIVLTVKGGQPTKVHLLFADDVSLVTLKSTAPTLPKRVEGAASARGRLPCLAH